MNHVTVGVYPNGEYVVNIVEEKHLKDHIEYNVMRRPGRLLFVDGKYHSGGCLKKDYLDLLIAHWEEEISKMNINTRQSSKVYT